VLDEVHRGGVSGKEEVYVLAMLAYRLGRCK